MSEERRKADSLKRNLDHSKWVARVHCGWDIALQVLKRDLDRGRSTDDLIDETLDIQNPYELDKLYLATALFTEPKWVEAPKELIYERADLIWRVKQLVRRLEDSVGSGVIPYNDETDLVRLWPEDTIIEAYELGQMLSDKPRLRRLAGYLLKTGPRDSTAERRKKVAALWWMRYEQVRTARQRYTANKKDDWKAIVTKADPQLPDWLINELPNRSTADSKQAPKQLAARWLAEDLRSTPEAILKDVKVLRKSGTLLRPA